MNDAEFEDFYLTLDAAETASAEELNRAWKRQMKKCHPDRNPGNPEYWEARCKVINAAYEALRDPQSRAAFDRTRKDFYEKKRAEEDARERAIRKIERRRKKREEQVEQHLRDIEEKKSHAASPEPIPAENLAKKVSENESETPQKDASHGNAGAKFPRAKIVVAGIALLVLVAAGAAAAFYRGNDSGKEKFTKTEISAHSVKSVPVETQRSVPVETPENVQTSLSKTAPKPREAAESAKEIVSNKPQIVPADVAISSAEVAEKTSPTLPQTVETPTKSGQEKKSGEIADSEVKPQPVAEIKIPLVPEKTDPVAAEPKSAEPKKLEPSSVPANVPAAKKEKVFCAFGDELGNPKTPGIIGNYYDLKEKDRGGSTPIAPADDAAQERYIKIGRQFVKNGWNLSKFKPYLKAPKTLSVGQIFIPPTAGHNSDSVPVAFGISGKKGSCWYVHYSGVVVPNKSGKIRFLGAADDIICVRFSKRNSLDSGYDLLTEKCDLHRGTSYTEDVLGESYVKTIKGFEKTPFRAGPWIRVKEGMRYSIEILLGESPGMHFYAALVFEVEGKRGVPAGRPMLMRFDENELPKEITAGAWSSEIDMTGGGWLFKPQKN